MSTSNNSKVDRVLAIYRDLEHGLVVNKSAEAQKYGVHERSIQRDLDDIRRFLDTAFQDGGVRKYIVYDRCKKGYILEEEYVDMLTNAEVLAVCKILLDSRAFVKPEMATILDKIISSSVPRPNQKLIKDLIKNEEFHYVELQHKLPLIDMIWDIGQAVRTSKYIEVEYLRLKDKNTVKRRLKPLAITFSEYYFYLIAFIDDDKINEKYGIETIVYRIDRIKNIKILEEHFKVPYKDKFELGEFRKRVQFMYGGNLQIIKFKYYDTDIDMVLDRLPTAEILEERDEYYLIEVKVFGEGIDMWFKSQGDTIEVVERRGLC